MTDCDAYARALFRLPLPNSILASVPLKVLLDNAASVGEAEKRIIGGREHIVLHLTADRPYDLDLKWKIDVYLDSTVNYLVRRAVYEATEPSRGVKRINDYQVTSFTEVAPSIFFPTASQCEYSENGKVLAKYVVTFSDVTVNRPLPANAFAFQFQQGMQLDDQIRNTRYRVDAAGNRISEEGQLGQRPIAPPTPAKFVTYGTPTNKEPVHWTSYLPWLFGALFLGSAVMWIVIKKREQCAN